MDYILKNTFFFALTFSGLSLLVQVNAAHAYLGGGVDSIEVDRKTLRAEKSPTQVRARSQADALPYTVTEMVAAGVQVREYLSKTGVVFGIAWSGSHHANVSALLGEYRSEYEKAFASNVAQFGLHRGFRGRTVRSENIQIDLGGHFRNMSGRAYSPALLPAGVNVNDIK